MAGVAQLERWRCKDNRAEENKTGEGADRNGYENQLVYQKDQSGLTDNTTTGGQEGPRSEGLRYLDTEDLGVKQEGTD